VGLGLLGRWFGPSQAGRGLMARHSSRSLYRNAWDGASRVFGRARGATIDVTAAVGEVDGTHAG
jgi:hypothetical protein